MLISCYNSPTGIFKESKHRETQFNLLDSLNLDGMAAMTVSKWPPSKFGFYLFVGCTGQNSVMFMSIIPYSNTRNTFMAFIFVLEHKK